MAPHPHELRELRNDWIMVAPMAKMGCVLGGCVGCMQQVKPAEAPEKSAHAEEQRKKDCTYTPGAFSWAPSLHEWWLCRQHGPYLIP